MTPLQNTNKFYRNYKRINNQSSQILKETKTLYDKKSHFSKSQIKEYSVLFILLNYLDIAAKNIEEISEIKFLSEKNEGLKKLIISLILDGTDPNEIQLRVKSEYKSLIDEIHENSNIQMITKAKNNEAILELLNELIKELKELDNLKKIESLEKELINNLDESSYSELIKLKNQLNRD